MANLLTQTAADLENGVFVQGSTNAGIVSIYAVNWKARSERTTDLTVTLPASTAGLIPSYYLIDSGHSDAFDGSPDDGTLQSVAVPTISGGKVTLSMQPRSVHLLQFTPPVVVIPPPPGLTVDTPGDLGVLQVDTPEALTP